MSNLISIHNLSVEYNQKVVLSNVNLEINQGDFIGVIGPNGGGKTTLVKAILGVIPFRGEVHYSTLINSGGVQRIGYLPQISNIDRHFPITLIDIALSGLQSRRRLFGRYTAEDKTKAYNLIEQVGIKDICHKTINEVSGGELQRALLCRALISDPELLILDEPTNFVDNRFENQMYALLHKLNEHMAIFMVSHDLGTISSHVKSILCVNRTVHLHHSNIITAEQLHNYHCPIQIISHGEIPHTVLEYHN